MILNANDTVISVDLKLKCMILLDNDDDIGQFSVRHYFK